MTEEGKVPACVGIIMDGNRRWAKERGLPTFEGHRAGLTNVKTIIRHAIIDRGVDTVILYAFSTENWNRSKEEVEYLMSLFSWAFEHEFAELNKDGIRLRFIGQIERLSENLQRIAREAEEKTAKNTRGTLAVAISYGGRPEILAAANRLLADKAATVDETSFRKAMWSADLPDPDLIIRTSGEQRLSNFLTWESVYSELFFTKTYWPAFSKDEFDSVLVEFAERERRHGK